MSAIEVRPLQEEDREWIGGAMRKQWHSELVISRGRVHHARDLPGFIAESDGEKTGFALYQIDGDNCELIVSFEPARRTRCGHKFNDLGHKCSQTD